MKTVKITLVALAGMISFNASAMWKARHQQPAAQPAQPVTTAGQARAGVEGLRKMVKGAYGQTMQQAHQGTAVGEYLGLKAEVKGVIDDVKGMGNEVMGMTGELQGVADISLETLEEELNKNSFLAKRPKLKKQIVKFVTETRTIVPTTVTAGIVAYLIYCYWQSQKAQQLAGAQNGETQTDGWFVRITDKIGGQLVRYGINEKVDQAKKWFGFGGQPAQQPVAPVEMIPVTTQSFTAHGQTPAVTTYVPITELGKAAPTKSLWSKATSWLPNLNLE